MITFFTLLIISILLFYCTSKTYNDGWHVTSFILGCIFSIWLILHTICWSLTAHTFNKLVVSRQSFVETLEESRKNGRELESAAILKEISGFNQRLASEKYNNQIWFLGQYVDDRIETLEPIK